MLEAQLSKEQADGLRFRRVWAAFNAQDSMPEFLNLGAAQRYRC